MSTAAPRGLYAVWASDAEGALALRERVRPAHRRRLRLENGRAVHVLAAGPTFSADGSAGGAMNGTLLILRAPNEAAIRTFLDEDPYQQHGVYARVEIRPWHCGLGPWAPDAEEMK